MPQLRETHGLGRRCLALLLLLGPARVSAEQAAAAATLKAGTLRIGLDSTGQLRSLRDARDDTEYLPPGQSAALISIEVEGRIEQPAVMKVARAGRELTLVYAQESITATIDVYERPTHLALELRQLSGATPKQILWGPFPTTIRETIGETVGVVRNHRIALGIQGLNLKTSGGARAAEFGSVLHASTQDRTRKRVKSAGDVKEIAVPAMQGPDAAVQGSRIALFGCPSDEALETIGQIELAEGLPHPMLDGVWAKVSPEATRSYLITPFGEQHLDEVLAVAGQAGLKYIYHMDPFKSWGHFDCAPAAFPDGVESLRRCVERAARAGIRVGVHTLSNFIQPNDPYVSPVPDPRLVRVGSSSLTAPVDAGTTTLPIADPGPFRQRQWLSTAMLGQELVQYDAVSEQEPWALLGCKRGAFNTKATSQPAGGDIGKLWDHSYRVFFPDLHLQDEMAGRLVELFNRTGLRQISFDGLEGCQVTGEGDYAEARFVKKCYDGWKQEVISDSSQLKHYTWHIHTRMNWGEPWGKAMREGMPEYRFKNQEYFRRNLLPPMLGWFQIQPASADLEATALDDVEWVLAKCAGFKAGCSWVTSLETLRGLGQTQAILTAIREWDRARHQGVFSDRQRERLRDPANEFHLETMGEARWQLTPVAFSPRFVRQLGRAETQPAPTEPWVVENRFNQQPLRFVLRVVAAGGGSADGFVANPSFEVDGQSIALPVRLKPREYLVSEGDARGVVYDSNWNLLRTVQAASAAPMLQSGSQAIRFECETAGGFEARAELRFKMIGSPEFVE